MLNFCVYDIRGRLTTILYANGNVYQRSYNADGSSTATLKNQSGVLLHSYAYDAARQVDLSFPVC